MSYQHYRQSIDVTAGNEIPGGPDFYSIIMAAIRRADDINLEKLSIAFPKQVEELRVRYNAPGGFVSAEEAKSFSEGFVQTMINETKFPMEGWPFGV